MPRSTREWAHRKIGEAEKNLEWVMYHLAEVAGRYEKAHPEIAEDLLNAAILAKQLAGYLEKCRSEF